MARCLAHDSEPAYSEVHGAGRIRRQATAKGLLMITQSGIAVRKAPRDNSLVS